MKNYRFLIYASSYMGEHVRGFEGDELTRQWLVKLLDSRAAIAVGSQILRWSIGYRSEYWNPEESKSVTALHVASICGLATTVSMLLQQQSQEVNIRTSMGSTPLIYASSAGHKEIVSMLLQKGADPFLSNWYGNALHCAAEAGETGIIRQLLDHGMDVDIPRRKGRTPLHCTADQDRAAAAHVLVCEGADIDARDMAGMSILHSASAYDSVNIIHLLFEMGKPDLESTSNRGLTPLHYAAANGRTYIARTLLEHQADMDARDNLGRTPLDHAISNGHRIMQSVLEAYL